MSHTTKLSTKGQVVLPKSLRSARGWKPGTEFLVQEHGRGVLLVPKMLAKTGSWARIYKSLPYSGPAKTLREMDEAIAAEARKHK